MNDKSSSSGPTIDADMKATGNIHIQDSFKIKIDGARKTEDILAALKFNRARLHQLKSDYAKSVAENGGILSKPSKMRRTYYLEISRSYGALEGCKDALMQRGVYFDLDQHDDEHPNDAYKRLTPKLTLFLELVSG
jgi:hypothetical protein